MRSTVYLETSIIGYLAMRPSNLLRVAANQQATQEWWDRFRDRYELVVSRYVIEECSAGDPGAAAERLAFLSSIRVLELSQDVPVLAAALRQYVPLPDKAVVDGLHIAVAAVNGIEYLLTWNCSHIANPELRRRIESVCRTHHFRPPVICTPQEFLETTDVH